MILNRWCFLVLLIASADPAAYAEQEKSGWSCLSRHVIELSGNAELIGAVQQYNQNPPDPVLLDKIWPVLEVHDADVMRVIKHPMAAVMDNVISGVSIQGEGMLMGLNGGLVAATNKTTDFWQGDESQFTDAITLLPGQVHVEGNTADESSHSMLIKISTPVFDSVQEKAIGVLMLGFDQFIVDFQETCGELETLALPASIIDKK